MSKCLECGYYDKEKHYCPFYCQLIRETLDEAISFELEKIKAEIEKKYPYTLSFNLPKKKIVIDCIDVIDNHIAELKGENNDNS